MSEQEELYSGPDRGEFLVRKLISEDGIFDDASCRIRNVSVFNFASEHAYALIGYQIEFWPNGAKAPYEEGGKPADLFRPQGRPDFTTFYMRAKISNTGRMLYLEDGIISDFINTKSTMQPMLLQDYETAAQQQLESISVDRAVGATQVMYREAMHVTRYASSATEPLVQVEQWMSYKAHKVSVPKDNVVRYIKDKTFTSLKDMVKSIVEDFSALIK